MLTHPTLATGDLSRDTGAGELKAALRSCRSAFCGVALMSGLMNLLYLTGSFFMLEVYDRVIPSRSMPTLVGLGLLALVLYTFQGCLDALRGRILTRVGGALDETLADRVFDLTVRSQLRGPAPSDGLLPLRDLDQLRAFLSGAGPGALFDLPWMPFYVAICFLFHPLLGVAALAGAGLLVLITIITDRLTRSLAQATTSFGLSRNALAQTGLRNAEVLTALGMQARLARRWALANAGYRQAQRRTADVSGGFGAFSKVMRMALQSGVLALGAWLVINDLATGGIIIASSILVSRALAPAELAIANWKGFVQARQSWARLGDLLDRLPPAHQPLALPPPQRWLNVEDVSVAPPGSSRIVVSNASFSLQAGQGLGIIGSSASGKSSLVRALVGVWPTLRGKVRLDGAALAQWSSEALGVHLGYLPQEAELFAGTVAENICRFEPAADSALVIAAAKSAGVHEMILRLPEGYETPLGDGGAGLSAGQRQRVGLARALYRDPFLVILDEPNANLDSEGENALTQAILGVRRRGGICLVVAHRPSALAAVDMVLMMGDGRVHAFGPKDEVIKRVVRPTPVPPAEVRPAILTEIRERA